MKKVLEVLKKEPMLSVSVLAALVAMLITPPSKALLSDIDWHTLATLFMMLTVLEGFKKENIFRPLLQLAGRMSTMVTLSLFLIFGVFFSSMFVTNDVSLIIFVPLTIILFRAGQKEEYILPVISMENIAAVRGSLLTPFGSPQNLFIFGRSGVSAAKFVLFMLPLSLMSAVLLIVFVLVLYRKDVKQATGISGAEIGGTWSEEGKKRRISYLVLFAVILLSIITRTALWPFVTLGVFIAMLFVDKQVLRKTDYVLLLTFLCFFIFSSSIAANGAISGFLRASVAGNEYIWSILLSQVISNVPGAIVLYPFSQNVGALLYGLDTAGLCSLIGSLASVINYRIYVREYPANGGKFIRTFTAISLAFFAVVCIPGYVISKVFLLV